MIPKYQRPKDERVISAGQSMDLGRLTLPLWYGLLNESIMPFDWILLRIISALPHLVASLYLSWFSVSSAPEPWGSLSVLVRSYFV